MADLRAARTIAGRWLVHERTLDRLGVYILPLLCLGVDFAIKGVGAVFYPLTLVTFVASGMVAFAVAGRTVPHGAAAPLLKGMLVAAGGGALLVGLGLLPLSILAFLEVNALGLLGLVPFLTAHRLLRRARHMAGRASLVLTGAALLVGVTALAFWVEWSSDQARAADLRSGDRTRVLRALSLNAKYAPRDFIAGPFSPWRLVCTELRRIPLQDPAVEAAVRQALLISDKRGIEESCERRINAF